MTGHFSLRSVPDRDSALLRREWYRDWRDQQRLPTDSDALILRRDAAMSGHRRSSHCNLALDRESHHLLPCKGDGEPEDASAAYAYRAAHRVDDLPSAFRHPGS